LANHKSAIKRIRTNERKRTRNRIYQSRTRTQVKKARVAIEGQSLEAAIEETRNAISLLDKAADKGIIHKRNAARRKSRMMKRLNALQAQQNGEEAEA
jgi:small subunit ribosomal protein S20